MTIIYIKEYILYSSIYRINWLLVVCFIRKDDKNIIKNKIENKEIYSEKVQKKKIVIKIFKLLDFPFIKV